MQNNKIKMSTLRLNAHLFFTFVTNEMNPDSR